MKNDVDDTVQLFGPYFKPVTTHPCVNRLHMIRTWAYCDVITDLYGNFNNTVPMKWM